MYPFCVFGIFMIFFFYNRIQEKKNCKISFFLRVIFKLYFLRVNSFCSSKLLQTLQLYYYYYYKYRNPGYKIHTREMHRVHSSRKGVNACGAHRRDSSRQLLRASRRESQMPVLSSVVILCIHDSKDRCTVTMTRQLGK